MAKAVRKAKTRAVSKPKTRAQWAAEIRAAHKQSCESILKIGRTLIGAKKALEHGTFEKMIERDLPFDATTAQRLMKIARDRRLTKAARVQLLPMAWGTLYELTKLPDAAFEEAVASGAIHPQMTREQAKMVRLQVTHETVRVAAPFYTTSDEAEPATVVSAPVQSADNDPLPMRLIASATQPEPEPMDLPPPPSGASLALATIERLVSELAMAVERGDFGVDAVFEGRVRAVADRLLSMIANDDRNVVLN